MDELNICRERGEGLRRALDEVYAYAEARILALQSKEVELKDKKSFALKERAKKVVALERKADGFRVEVEAKRKELNFLRYQTELERYHEGRDGDSEEAERKLKDLTLVQDKIEGCEKVSSEVVSKEKELEVVCKKIDLREQAVMSVNNDMMEACQRMETKRKELENIQKLIEKHSEQLASAEIAPALAPVNNVISFDVKPEETINISVSSLSHLPNEDGLLRDIECSTSLSPNEVCTELPMFKDPGRFVLTSVEKALTDASERGELSLEEPILMSLVPLLEELARVVVISTDPDLQSDATRVAHRWVNMMGASVEKSQLEAWAVLQFIVHCCVWIDFVTQLFDKGLYIPAIRFMLSFNVKNNFSPLELLKEQIINLRLSAKENRRYESQAEEANRDAATMAQTLAFQQALVRNRIKLVVQLLCCKAGSKRPTVDAEGPRPVIRPCFNPPSGFGVIRPCFNPPSGFGGF
ncbi:hypothetical protein DY000_02011209 [Brassica cretica]|uniref:FRIGIDA-like protein n=1 Tax=Brassica cretica TaxID=69181 RepID=A0ABQ7CQM0_BRACR|nr:hypothetical protein DY000_02011209 [Brassica cretica]